LRVFLETYKGEPEKISYLYLGAIGNKKVGEGAPVAKATKVIYLDYNYTTQLKKGDWSRAAYFINEFNHDDTAKRLNRLDSETLKKVHEAAAGSLELGVDSGAAKTSAELLAERSSRGDIKALLLPTIRGEGKDALLQAARPIDGIQPSRANDGTFTITVDGQPEKLMAAQVGAIRDKAAGVLRDHLRRVETKASTAYNGYQSQSEVDKQHWIVAPIVKTLGRVKDPGPDLLAYVARANTDVQMAREAVNGGRFEQAAQSLASAEGAALSANKMWQAYFQGIINAGETTVTVLEITRDAAFITLGILATIATGGAAAGTLGVAEGAGATTTVVGAEVGTATAANVIAAGAPVVANLAEAVAKVSLGDKVDWGALVIDSLVQIVIARFGGKVTAGIGKALLGNPATENLASRVTEKVVHAAVMQAGSTALMVAAQNTYRALKGQNITWQNFADELVTRLTDPKSLAVIAVTGALTSAAEAKFAPRASSPMPHEPTQAPPQPRQSAATSPGIAEPIQRPPPTSTQPGQTTPAATPPRGAPTVPSHGGSSEPVSEFPKEPSAPSSERPAGGGSLGQPASRTVSTPAADVQSAGQALELDTGPQPTRPVAHAERDLESQPPGEALELDTGRQPTRPAPHGELDLGPETAVELELDHGPLTAPAPTLNERDLGDVPTGQSLKIYRGRKPLGKIPGVAKTKQTFGEASTERSGTHNRTGANYGMLNAAEIAHGLRVDYDPVAGRPRSVEYRVDAASGGTAPAEDRAFARDKTTEGAQSTNSAYEHSGLEHGHLGQREAFKGSSETELAADQFTNIVPMVPELNRLEGSPWRASEIDTMRWARQYESVTVLVEPIYDSEPDRLRDGTPIPKAVRRRVTAPDGTVLQDASFLNRN
jgi:DNA/RNA endonuclease G (NUC1)